MDEDRMLRADRTAESLGTQLSTERRNSLRHQAKSVSHLDHGRLSPMIQVRHALTQQERGYFAGRIELLMASSSRTRVERDEQYQQVRSRARGAPRRAPWCRIVTVGC
jgi:hypothetical protein